MNHFEWTPAQLAYAESAETPVLNLDGAENRALKALEWAAQTSAALHKWAEARVHPFAGDRSSDHFVQRYSDSASANAQYLAQARSSN